MIGVENKKLKIHATTTKTLALLQLPEKFIGLVIASYLSMLNATKT